MFYNIFIIFSLLIFIIGCEQSPPKEISGNDITQSFAICEKNLGLSKIILHSEALGKPSKYPSSTLCQNGAFSESHSSLKPNHKSPYYVTNQEIEQCSALCKENNLIKKITIGTVCLKESPPFTRYRSCDESGINISCVCNNSITKAYQRPF